jgi:hypothetical protein
MAAAGMGSQGRHGGALDLVAMTANLPINQRPLARLAEAKPAAA